MKNSTNPKSYATTGDMPWQFLYLNNSYMPIKAKIHLLLSLSPELSYDLSTLCNLTGCSNYSTMERTIRQMEADGALVKVACPCTHKEHAKHAHVKLRQSSLEDVNEKQWATHCARWSHDNRVGVPSRWTAKVDASKDAAGHKLLGRLYPEEWRYCWDKGSVDYDKIKDWAYTPKQIAESTGLGDEILRRVDAKWPNHSLEDEQVLDALVPAVLIRAAMFYEAENPGKVDSNLLRFFRGMGKNWQKYQCFEEALIKVTSTQRMEQTTMAEHWATLVEADVENPAHKTKEVLGRAAWLEKQSQKRGTTPNRPKHESKIPAGVGPIWEPDENENEIELEV